MVFSGSIDDEKDKEGKPKEIGRPFNLPENRKIAAALQPIYAGGFTPTIDLYANRQTSAFAKIEGPYCFGGWSELCCDFEFFVSFMESEKKTGQSMSLNERTND